MEPAASIATPASTATPAATPTPATAPASTPAAQGDTGPDSGDHTGAGPNASSQR
jgi:hypothetical protein